MSKTKHNLFHRRGIGPFYLIFFKQEIKITDGTQMALFTAEGILRAETRRKEKGICHPPSVVYYAYQRWLSTQGYGYKVSGKSEVAR